jgi:hypothetical protein
MRSSAGLDGRLPLIGTGKRADAVFWRGKTEFWQALTARAEQRPLSCFPTARRLRCGPETSSLEVKLNDQERRVVGRLLTERKALLIETTEDTTQRDPARRAGSIELSVIESILGKLTAASAMRLGVAEGIRKLSRPT